MADQPKYSAFISYSRANEEAVRKLYKRLSAYRLPSKLRAKHGSKLGRFFLDKEELGAAGELDEELFEKLDQTRRLIVCCSPAAAKSKWVNAEAKSFIDKHGRNNLLAVVLEGEPHDAFPPVLLEDEPLAADFRPTADGEEHGFLKLVAGLLYIDLGELRDLQAQAERRQARIRNALVALFAALAITATVAAFIAVQAQRRAERMTTQAISIGAGVVTKADEMSRKLGMPTSAVEELLGFADRRFDTLFEEGVRSDELSRQRMKVLVKFSELYGRVGDSGAQTETASRAVAILDALPPQKRYSVDYAEAWAVYGDARRARGDGDGAREAYRKAIQVSREALESHPDGKLVRNRLAGTLQRLAELDILRNPNQALPHFEEAARLLEEIVAMDPDDGLAAANAIIGLNWVGSAQSLAGNPSEGRRAFEQAIERAERFLAAHPDSLPARNALAASEMKLGQALSQLGEPVKGREHFVKSVTATRRLSEADPRDANQQRNLALRLALLGNLDVEQGRFRDGVTSLRAAAPIYERLIARDPHNVDQRRTYRNALAVEAQALIKLDDPENALARRARAAELLAARVDVATETRLERLDALASALELWGDAAAQARNLDRMLDAYRAAEPVRRRIRDLDDVPGNRRQLASVLHALGLTLKFAKQASASANALEEAATLRLALDTPGDQAAGAQSLQQLAVVQAGFDGEASKKSLVKAKQVLTELVATHPDNESYVGLLKKTEEVLKLFK